MGKGALVWLLYALTQETLSFGLSSVSHNNAPLERDSSEIYQILPHSPLQGFWPYRIDQGGVYGSYGYEVSSSHKLEGEGLQNGTDQQKLRDAQIARHSVRLSYALLPDLQIILAAKHARIRYSYLDERAQVVTNHGDTWESLKLGFAQWLHLDFSWSLLGKFGLSLPLQKGDFDRDHVVREFRSYHDGFSLWSGGEVSYERESLVFGGSLDGEIYVKKAHSLTGTPGDWLATTLFGAWQKPGYAFRLGVTGEVHEGGDYLESRDALTSSDAGYRDLRGLVGVEVSCAKCSFLDMRFVFEIKPLLAAKARGPRVLASEIWQVGVEVMK